MKRKSLPAKGQYTETARQSRLNFLRTERNTTLEHIATTQLNPKSLVSNTENFIGSVEVPIGIAGPLLIRGNYADGEYYIPLATTEGALVASAARGAKTLSEAGGVAAHFIAQKVNRVPVFIFTCPGNATRFCAWIQANQSKLCDIAHAHTSHGRLQTITPIQIKNRVYVEFCYTTGNAAGQNMSTVCTWQACQWILEQVKKDKRLSPETYYIESNFSSDKKTSYRSLTHARGTHVKASCLLSPEIIQRHLKIDAGTLLDIYQITQEGAQLAGIHSYNINFANIIAAIFTATGQDIACTHESALGTFSLKPAPNGNFEASVDLPCLMIGTVGGGTHLYDKHESLALLGCHGDQSLPIFAEIIASTCLALELSTMSAIGSDTFARAHDRLGRNRPITGLRLDEINQHFFQKILDQHSAYQHYAVTSIQGKPMQDETDSIITEVTGQHCHQKWVGLRRIDVTVKSKHASNNPSQLNNQSPLGPSHSETRSFLVKSKPKDSDLIQTLSAMANECGSHLGSQFNLFKDQLIFTHCHLRELKLYQMEDHHFKQYLPTTFHVEQNDQRETYLIVQEYLDSVTLLNCAHQPDAWQPHHIRCAIAGIADIHAHWYDQKAVLQRKPWYLGYEDADTLSNKMPLWQALLEHGHQEFPEWFQLRHRAMAAKLIQAIPHWAHAAEQLPKTLIHNDFNTRNIALRNPQSAKESHQVCIFDWELASIGLPQRDLAELLAFTLKPNTSRDTVIQYLEYHRQQLTKHSQRSIGRMSWLLGFHYGLMEFALTRLPFYYLIHTLKQQPFLERIHHTTYHLIELFDVIDNLAIPQTNMVSLVD